jgi:predicted Ser/Thr protein kinase
MMTPILATFLLGGPELLILLVVAVLGIGLLIVAVVFTVWRSRRRKQTSSPLHQPPSPPPPTIPATVELPKCPQCQQPLPENAPEGLCPACLAKVALGGEPPTPGGGTININPMGEAAPGARVPPDPTRLAAQFPQLEIIELLGMGGMGMVYKARQPRLDRLVALKILPVESAAHPSFGERFNREAKALAKLNHPGIVDVYDFGQTDQYFYFVMEYVDGMNLRWLLNTRTVTPSQALELVVQICTALQYAHDEGVVHRDIKPENILINKKGQVKIADFGLAKILGTVPDTALTMSQAAMGTLNYMAPEQRENAQGVDHRADIYSLGVVFYELLTGEVPMGRFEPPSKRVQVDVRLDEVVLRALEREPARRYQHVSEVKTNVETITSSAPPKANAPGTPEAFKPQVLPGFVTYVFKRFAIFVVAWLVAGLCLRWAVGDTSLTVAPHSALPIKVLCGIFIFIFGLVADLEMAKFLLPAVFVLVVYAWLEARDKRGLTTRQLPPSIRRRLALWVTGISGGYVVVALATLFFWNTFFPYAALPFSLREYQNRSDEAAEWFFVPYSGAYEKLDCQVTFSASEPLPACTVALIVHRKDMETPVMNVTLPGLRASYRFPATNSWDNTFILDKDSLVDWLHKGAGLDLAAPKFHEEAGQIYALLKAYELQPPQTVKEFVNLAKADLRAFWFGGKVQGGSFSFGGVRGTYFVLLIAVIGVETLIYPALALWATRRLYRAAWIEIEAGRWTPPIRASKPLPTTLKILGASTIIPVGLAGLFVVRRGIHYLPGWMLSMGIPMLVISEGLGILLILALYLYSRWQIQQARERGLWPQWGELATLEHVQHLAQAEEKVLAIKLYRQIYPVSLMDAKAAVEKIASAGPATKK